MSISANALRQHVDYSIWANRRLLEAAQALTSEQLSRDFNTADKSPLGTLAHLFAAETIWLARVEGAPPAPIGRTVAEVDLPALIEQWRAIDTRWRNWASRLSDEDANSVIHYTDLRARPWSQPLWEILLHVVNHSTHHRGQVAGFLRAMGKTPPSLDFIAFIREKAA